MATIYIAIIMHANPLTAFRRVWRIRKLDPGLINREETDHGAAGIRQQRRSIGFGQGIHAGWPEHGAAVDGFPRQGRQPGRSPDTAGRSAGAGRSAQTAHGSADVALAVGAVQATGRGRDFQGTRRSRRPPLRRPGMARESDLRLSASGVPAQHALCPRSRRADSGGRRQGAQPHALPGTPDFRRDGAVELRRDQSRVHQAGYRYARPEHYRRHQQPARGFREGTHLDDRRIGLRSRQEHRDDRGCGRLRERTDATDPVRAADAGSRHAAAGGCTARASTSSTSWICSRTIR